MKLPSIGKKQSSNNAVIQRDKRFDALFATTRVFDERLRALEETVRTIRLSASRIERKQNREAEASVIKLPEKTIDIIDDIFAECMKKDG